jgi:glycosyltransferase involved in cell wall biosynthesis
MEDFLLRRFNRVVTVSTLLVPFILAARVSPEKLTVIDNGIDFSEFASVRPSEDLESAKEGRLAVGVVGRLTAGKGHQRLFEAMPRVLSENPSVVLFVIGDGPLREALVALGKRLGIDSKLVFTGRRDDMPSVYAALDVVVLPSLYEGMPLVVLESLAASKAIIATQVGSIPEVIRNEVTGLLVEPDNSASLAIAIRRLIADATMRQSLGANGHAFARDHFSAAAMTRKYLSVYESAMHD